MAEFAFNPPQTYSPTIASSLTQAQQSQQAQQKIQSQLLQLLSAKPESK